MKKIKKLLSDSCILFTVFVFILLVACALFVEKTQGVIRGLALETAVLLFICALLLRIFHNILHIEKLNIALRVIFHYVLVVGTSFAASSLISSFTNNKSNQVTSFVILSVITLVYSGIIVVDIIIKRKKQEKKNQAKEYKSIVDD